ncbi:MAG: hypothetical protein LIO71_09055 [Ruminococcus sp.]|nr:hypothetical protein [Ruminococcus sp.]
MNILKKSIVWSVIISCLTLTACGGSSETTEVEDTTSTTTSSVEETEEETMGETEEETQEETTELLTASQVLEYIQGKCSSIGNYIEYTSETDTNGLLGRPNQYTGKINGADTRLEQSDENDPIGFSIEVFANNTDAQARADYIENIYTQMPMLAEYDYINDYILIRVDGDLTPEQAQEYEDALKDIFN